MPAGRRSTLLATWSADASTLPPFPQPLVGAGLSHRRTGLDVAAIQRTEVTEYLRAVAAPAVGPTALPGILATLAHAIGPSSPAAWALTAHAPTAAPVPTAHLNAAAAAAAAAATAAAAAAKADLAPAQASAVMYAWLQPWRLAYAGALVDWGLLSEARAYTDALLARARLWPAGVPPPPIYTAAFFATAIELDERLRGAGVPLPPSAAAASSAALSAAGAAGSGGAARAGGGAGGGSWLRLDGWKDLLDRGLDLVIGDPKGATTAAAAAATAGAGGVGGSGVSGGGAMPHTVALQPMAARTPTPMTVPAPVPTSAPVPLAAAGRSDSGLRASNDRRAPGTNRDRERVREREGGMDLCVCTSSLELDASVYLCVCVYGTK
jgi:hypothetical protein